MIYSIHHLSDLIMVASPFVVLCYWCFYIYFKWTFIFNNWCPVRKCVAQWHDPWTLWDSSLNLSLALCLLLQVMRQVPGVNQTLCPMFIHDFIFEIQPPRTIPRGKWLQKCSSQCVRNVHVWHMFLLSFHLLQQPDSFLQCSFQQFDKWLPDVSSFQWFFLSVNLWRWVIS